MRERERSKKGVRVLVMLLFLREREVGNKTHPGATKGFPKISNFRSDETENAEKKMQNKKERVKENSVKGETERERERRRGGRRKKKQNKNAGRRYNLKPYQLQKEEKVKNGNQ